MKLSEIVRGEPGQYVAEQGAVQALPSYLSIFRRPVIVTGEKSFAAFLKHYGKEVDWPVFYYDRTASYEDVERLAEEIRGLDADVLVGIGGGKALDTTKMTADRLGIEVVLVPTLVATCAGSTPLAVAYYPDHRFREPYYCKRSGFMTLVDYDLLLDSPHAYFLSGVSDTLAKWYEVEILHRQKERSSLPAMLQLALATAHVSREILLKDTQEALADHLNGQFTSTFKRIVDTVYAVAANVGCQTNQHVSGAHALHNGLTVLPETHAVQHGLKVSYGILVQLCVTGDEDEVRKLLPFYQQVGFIYSWDQLGVTEEKETAQAKVAAAAAVAEESFVLVKEGLTAADVLAGMLRLEELVAEVLKEEHHD